MGRDAAEQSRSSQAGQPSRSDRARLTDETARDKNLSFQQSPANSPGEFRIRCPHCHNSCVGSEDTSLSDVTCPACGSHFNLIVGDETQAYAPASPRTIAGFQLVEQVGSGKFGTVWKARDLQLDRIVAVKIPRRGELDVAESEQFFREARAAAQVDHPNVVSIHTVAAKARPITSSATTSKGSRSRSGFRGSGSRLWKRRDCVPSLPMLFTRPTRRAWSTATSSPPT